MASQGEVLMVTMHALSGGNIFLLHLDMCMWNVKASLHITMALMLCAIGMVFGLCLE